MFISFLAFLGIYAGFALALIAPEEIKPGQKYFKPLLSILIALVFFLAYYQKNFIVSIILCLLMLVYVYVVKNSRYIYSLCGILIFFATDKLIVASILFLTGMVVSSIEAGSFVKIGKENTKISKPLVLLEKITYKNILFLVFSLLPFFFSYL